jgi:hypothetical protein
LNTTTIYCKNRLIYLCTLPKHKKYVFYAPEPITTFGLQTKYGFDELDGLKHLLSILKHNDYKDVYIVVKGHPNQNHKIFYDYLKMIENKKIIYVEDYDINQIIYYSDVVVGYFSNSLIESQKMGKKVLRILVDLKNINIDPLKHMDIGVKILDIKKLTCELDNIFIKT